MRVIGLIPTRLNSSRLPQKSLLEIDKIPLIMHVYKRSLLSKNLDDLYVCCDDQEVAKVIKKFKGKFKITSTNHNNGTERIYEGYKSIKKKYDLIVDIQGDEPLLSPHHIDKVVEFHKKNLSYDIILPHIKIKYLNNPNIVKIIFNKKNEVMYLTRANVPFHFKSSPKYIFKHLSIVSFKPDALKYFAKSKKSIFEKIEDVELLRALDLGLKIKTLELKGDSFSVDIMDDYEKAKVKILSDKFYKKYK
tara:strand:- start:443 stop:1186 length:744 start_codon:yes stop_codon:yes gene_type:complete